MAGPTLTYAELSTVLAALRAFQSMPDEDRRMMDHFVDVEPLDDNQIDELCERLNYGAAAGECHSWNTKYEVGTEVDVRMDNGEVRRTRTRSAAGVLSGDTAVIWLEGISGCYLLERVTPAATAAAAPPERARS